MSEAQCKFYQMNICRSKLLNRQFYYIIANLGTKAIPAALSGLIIDAVLSFWLIATLNPPSISISVNKVKEFESKWEKERIKNQNEWILPDLINLQKINF